MTYCIAQVMGGVLGVVIAHTMFDLEIVQISLKSRDGLHLIFAEGVATFGLVMTILGCIKYRPDFTAVAVGLYITSAYWFTASTSFANPAVTLARSLSDTFAGIAPASVLPFIGAQCIGGVIGYGVGGWLFSPPACNESDQ